MTTRRPPQRSNRQLLYPIHRVDLLADGPTAQLRSRPHPQSLRPRPQSRQACRSRAPRLTPSQIAAQPRSQQTQRRHSSEPAQLATTNRRRVPLAPARRHRRERHADLLGWVASLSEVVGTLVPNAFGTAAAREGVSRFSEARPENPDLMPLALALLTREVEASEDDTASVVVEPGPTSCGLR